ncbi:MAG: amidohydrolase family protein [Woeseia sp.]
MKIPWVLGATLTCVLAAGSVSMAAGDDTPRQFDYVIRNGLVVDGSGSVPYRADVAIAGDRIVAIGDLSKVVAEHDIDASGLVVTPGFIDVHSHAADGLIAEDRSAAVPLLAQGLTTVIVNPDGGGPLDMATQQAELLEHGLGVNVAQFVPHGTLRRQVIGMEDRLANDDDLEAMGMLLDAAMKDGAIGLSSGVFYAPASYSDTNELIELAKIAAQYGGVYASHIRDESDYSIGLAASVDEVISIATAAGITSVVTHIKAAGPSSWKTSGAIINKIEKARANGVDVWADQYPYVAASTGLGSALIPRWAMAGGIADMRARFDEPKTLAKIYQAIDDNLVRRGGAERVIIGASAEFPISGMSLAKIAEQWELSAAAATVTILRKEQVGIISFNMDAFDVANFMQPDWVMTSTDGGYPTWGVGNPHPRSFGAFARKIRKYVIEDELITLQAAVRSMSGLSASVFDLTDRGQLESGAYADVLVFDPTEFRDQATFQEPFQLATGIQYALVNGRLAIDDGKATGELAGRILVRAGSQ